MKKKKMIYRMAIVALLISPPKLYRDFGSVSRCAYETRSLAFELEVENCRRINKGKKGKGAVG